jgi:hypothetical protein
VGEYQGAFALCTVQDAEFLDENFQRFEELVIEQPKIVYVRQVDAAETANSFLIDISTEEADGTAVDSVQGVTMSRLGVSSVFLSEPVTIDPQPGLALATTTSSARTPLTSNKTVKAPKRQKGRGKAKRAALPITQCVLDPGYVVEFFVDTTFDGKTFHQDGSGRNPAGGQQPNVLYADGTSITQVSAWVHAYSPTTRDTPGVENFQLGARITDLANGALLNAGAATTSIVTSTDANGWAQFSFQAAPISAASNGIVASAKVEIVSPLDPTQGVLNSTNVYSYGTYDFRNLPVTNADLNAPGLSVEQIQSVFEEYLTGSDSSFLANLFFKGRDAFVDTAGLCQAGSTNCDFDPVLDTQWYTATACPGCDLLTPGIAPISAAQTFFNVAQARNISAFTLLAMAQREKGLLKAPSMPDSRTLDWAMGVGKVPTKFLDQIEAAAAAIRTWILEPAYPLPPPGLAQSFPVPADGPFFFPSRDVPIINLLVGTTKMVGYQMGQCSRADDAIDRYNVAFSVPNRANYVLWRYNSWIQACTEPEGGGNRYLVAIVNRLHLLSQ